MPVNWAMHKLKDFSYERATTIPITFLTAHYGLNHLAKLKAGGKYGFSAGAGGVGLAAIQLAKL